MTDLRDLKERTVTETPLLLFECVLPSGEVQRWSTHGVAFEGNAFEARVLRHNLFDVSCAEGDGIDTFARLSITLSNTDSRFSQIERACGWKGSQMTVRFLFFDVLHEEPASEAVVLFKGIADPPEEITESTFRLSVHNRLNLQRVFIPDVRVQKRCPWKFPATAAQQSEALDGGAKGKYS